jgi:hypothetical protein
VGEALGPGGEGKGHGQPPTARTLEDGRQAASGGGDGDAGLAKGRPNTGSSWRRRPGLKKPAARPGGQPSGGPWTAWASGGRDQDPGDQVRPGIVGQDSGPARGGLPSRSGHGRDSPVTFPPWARVPYPLSAQGASSGPAWQPPIGNGIQVGRPWCGPHGLPVGPLGLREGWPQGRWCPGRRPGRSRPEAGPFPVGHQDRGSLGQAHARRGPWARHHEAVL